MAAGARPHELEGRTLRCPCCGQAMLAKPGAVWFCPDCGWAGYLHPRLPLVCPLHPRRMEKLGKGWCCPEGCVLVTEGGDASLLTDLEEEAAATVTSGGDDSGDEDAWQAQQEWAWRIVAPGRRGGRRRRRYPSSLQQKLDAWRRRNRRGG